MWSGFFAAGGFGMYPVAIFGFLLIAVSVLYAIRPHPKIVRLVLTLGLLTFASGLLGTFVGMCNTFHYLPQVAQNKQLEIGALGCEESLHNAVLALMLVILGGIIAAAGHLRAPTASASTAAA